MGIFWVITEGPPSSQARRVPPLAPLRGLGVDLTHPAALPRRHPLLAQRVSSSHRWVCPLGQALGHTPGPYRCFSHGLRRSSPTHTSRATATPSVRPAQGLLTQCLPHTPNGASGSLRLGPTAALTSVASATLWVPSVGIRWLPETPSMLNSHGSRRCSSRWLFDPAPSQRHPRDE